ncbi:hypothetical protein HA466_0204140 [Hirschfeldia incana]|nr:hypothetical protein HA466_0204140 [Hirschfeldia incana]
MCSVDCEEMTMRRSFRSDGISRFEKKRKKPSRWSNPSVIDELISHITLCCCFQSQVELFFFFSFCFF